MTTARNLSEELCTAAKSGDINRVRQLLDEGADPNTPYIKNTPLPLAAEAGHVAVVQLLIERKAHTESRNERKETALHCVAYSKLDAHQITKILLAANADPDAVDRAGCTPLITIALNPEFSIQSNLADVVKQLIAANANINAISETYGTALHCAAMWDLCNDQLIFQQLLALKADPHVTNSKGQTPLTTTLLAISDQKDEVYNISRRFFPKSAYVFAVQNLLSANANPLDENVTAWYKSKINHPGPKDTQVTEILKILKESRDPIISFLLGLHPRPGKQSTLARASKSPLFDRQVIRKILELLGVRKYRQSKQSIEPPSVPESTSSTTSIVKSTGIQLSQRMDEGQDDIVPKALEKRTKDKRRRSLSPVQRETPPSNGVKRLRPGR